MNPKEQVRTAELTFRRKRILATLAAVALLLGSLWFAEVFGPKRTPAFSAADRGVLVIDPGHGGIDGGAIAYNGVKESELNLSIALKMQQLASFYGVETRMTRQDESPRTELDSYSEREELSYRADLAEETENSVLISIHQNFFPTSQPSGAQVLYGSGTESHRLGELTHRNLVEADKPPGCRAGAGGALSHFSCELPRDIGRMRFSVQSLGSAAAVRPAISERSRRGAHQFFSAVYKRSEFIRNREIIRWPTKRKRSMSVPSAGTNPPTGPESARPAGCGIP